MKSPAEVPTAGAVGTWWMNLSLYGAMIFGYVAFGYFASSPLDNPEAAFIALLRAVLAPWIARSLTVTPWAKLTGGIFDVYKILPGFITGFLMTRVCSLLESPPASVDDFFDY